MVYCAVVGCKSRTFTKAEKEKARQNNQELSNFRFFKIPKVRVHECGKTKQLSERRQREWIARLNRKGVSEDPQKYKVCCRHFSSDAVCQTDMSKEEIKELENSIVRLQLQLGALADKFRHQNSTEKSLGNLY
ncbi:hypothetical protein HPB52_010086 [Rhipicephalus sanguineus]|uniref:THAP-type domain-containing protein n=1 Tax=Rhipicephalus sanguineus TaxID=34632 RepID=A0A9D4PLM0_RHISA|nr:hypothetical protein HPB52_010086 [Rhipicephalus sanguineus]